MNYIRTEVSEPPAHPLHDGNKPLPDGSSHAGTHMLGQLLSAISAVDAIPATR